MAKILKKSNARKDIAGTTRTDRKRIAKLPETLVDPASQDDDDIHNAPTWLNEDAMLIYKQLAVHLRSVNAFFPIDKYALSNAAYWMALHRRAITMAENNLIQTFETGARQLSPEFLVLQKAEENARKYFELLGITPKNREAIGVFNTRGGDENQDPFALLMKKISAHAEEPIRIIKQKKS